MVAKSLSRKQVLLQKVSWYVVWSEIFIVAKSFPREQVLYKIFVKNFWSKHFWLQNHFLENRFLPNIFIKIFLVENFLWLQNNFLENLFLPKMFIEHFQKKFFGNFFLLLQNHFLENRFEPKIFIKNFLVENFYHKKIISSKTDSYEKSSNFFGQKFFYGRKIISYKKAPTKHFRRKFVCRKVFWCIIISSKTGSSQTFS